MSKKVVVFLGGGSMEGIFGAGIVTKFQEKNIYPQISTIYGASAGAYNMAYFLSKQTKLGSTIYYEDLIKGFIFPFRFFKSIFDRILNKYTHNKKQTNLIKINRLLHIAKNKKRLNINKIKKNPINAFIRVFDTKKNKIISLNLKDNVFQRLKEATSVIPYYVPPKNQRYVDSNILEEINYKELRKKHPNQKIIFCLNYKIKKSNRLKKIRKYFEGVLTSPIYPKINIQPLFNSCIKNFEENIKLIKKDPNCLLITPPEGNPTTLITVNSKKLKKTYNLGKKEAKKIIKFINK